MTKIQNSIFTLLIFILVSSVNTENVSRYSGRFRDFAIAI